MKINKINILQGSWVDSFYQEEIRPVLERKQIPILSEKVLSLTHLYDEKYWGEIRSTSNTYFAVIDHRHWYYDDGVFDEYVNKIISVRFPVVRIFESPFGFELPLIDIDGFTKKLFARTEQLATAIRNAHPETILLSPGIGVVNNSYIERYLNYLISSRSFFDGYAVHICNNTSEHSLGKVGSLLTRLMDVLPKKIWVTKWAIPSFEGIVANSGILGPVGWQPLSYQQAKHRLRRAFSIINTGAIAGSNWFYTGIGQDVYKPRRTPGPQEFWNPPRSFTPDTHQPIWDFWHFLGFGTSDRILKKDFFEAFLQLVQEFNE